MTDFLRRFVAAVVTLVLGSTAIGCETWAETAEKTPAWVATWLETQVRAPMTNGAASLASVSVVSDGKIVAALGLGCNGGPDGEPIDPSTDRFLIASVTKTFTALAVKRLVDDGTITSIDDPANTYLERITLPNWDGTEVTIRHLLSHRSGFEERGFGYVRHGLTTIPADANYAQRAIPEIVREPGTLTVYANINPPILGAMVEDLTGQTLQDFMRQQIFQPFGMTNTDLGYAEVGTPALALPWSPTTEGHETIPHKANAPFFAPTGSIEATATDMARYAIGVFEADASGEGAELLEPLGGNHPSLPSVGMAWFLTDWNDQPVAQHAGAFGVFSSWLVLIPETQTAMFIGWAGSPTKDEASPFDFGLLRDSFLQAALGPHETPEYGNGQEGYPKPGRYMPERRPHKSPEMVLALGAPTDVVHTEDGFMFRGQGPYRPIADGVFAAKPADGRAPQIIAVREGLILESSNAWAAETLLTSPSLRTKATVVAAVLGIIAAGAAIVMRLPGAWSTFILPVVLATAGAALLAPGPGGSSFFSDIFSAQTWRMSVLFASSCLLIVSAATPTALLLRHREELAWPARVVLLSSSAAALILLTTALYLNLFTPLSLN
ncbi:MAG: serine hydrolase domain-containing protein [Pseudomonadota bacterium]